jgi:hypothetical protein
MEDELGGDVARIGGKRNASATLVAEPEGERPLGGPTLTWEDNIRKDLREISWVGVD